MLNLPVPQSIPALTAAIEALHPPRGPYISSMAPTGESFISFYTEGPKPEGSLLTVHTFNEQTALRHYWLEFISHSQHRKGFPIYWRMKPVFDYEPYRTSDGIGHIDREIVIVRSRFLLSNKKILSPEFEEVCLGTRNG